MMDDGTRVPRIPVYLEHGTRRVFACALEWPGWCRAGRTAELALAMLARYARRYAPVAHEACLPFDPEVFDRDVDVFEVVESVPGGPATNVGAPAEIPAADAKPLAAAEAERHAALVQAAWRTLDLVAASAPAHLAKGPRGGGRDRDTILCHVIGAEAAYARRIGVRCSPPTWDDHAGVAAMRADIVAVLSAPSDGSLLVPTGWPVRYAARRIGWHALDHAWEMQDRSG
jgi:hypothetical protein